MFPSCEIRWFFKGDIPDEIQKWFFSLDESNQYQPERIDHYLKIPDQKNLGIKLREGRIEIKKQKEEPSFLKINEKVSGYSDCWEKWSFELKETDKLPVTDVKCNEWIEVRKKRNMYLFEIVNGICISRSPESGTIKNGCIAELTRISVHDKLWWTLGLEAFGETDKMLKNLLIVCSHIFSGSDYPSFQSKNSISYPGWLSKSG